MPIFLFKKRKIFGKLVKKRPRPDSPPPPSYSIYYISVHRLEVLHGASFVCLFVLFVCLVVCLGFSVSLQNFSFIWRRHQLCSALLAIEQWGFFSVPFPLKHRLNWPSPIISDPHTAEWSGHHLFLRLRSIGWGSNTYNLSACDVNCATAAVTVHRLKDNNPLVTLWSSTRESNLENFKICHFRINK